jgi:hypothetical protein
MYIALWQSRRYFIKGTIDDLTFYKIDGEYVRRRRRNKRAIGLFNILMIVVISFMVSEEELQIQFLFGSYQLQCLKFI